MSGVPKNTVRAASQADSLVSEMRALVQLNAPKPLPTGGTELERGVSSGVTTILMLLLVMLVFITSAVPDIGPSLAAVIRTHL